MILLLSLAIAAGLFAGTLIAGLLLRPPRVTRIDGRLLRRDRKTIEGGVRGQGGRG